MTADAAKDEQVSKDEFFQRLADLSQEMIAAHGEDFTMGALILGARYIAEKKAKPEEQVQAKK
jgi:hypothetical protein